MPPTIYSTPPTTATAGYTYYYAVDALYTYVPFHCNSIEGVNLPAGAVVDDYYDAVSWTSTSDLIGKKVYLRLRRNRTAVSPGESVTLTASFTGSGTIERIGPVTSGVPVTTNLLTSTTKFTLIVTNEVGTVKTSSVTVEVQAPPAIRRAVRSR
ncbi:MAG: hypothetical protein IE886_05695 [Campylobacterales bacterium]|nr:hypothetical protein [Campylobacterales bacterium]